MTAQGQQTHCGRADDIAPVYQPLPFFQPVSASHDFSLVRLSFHLDAARLFAHVLPGREPGCARETAARGDKDRFSFFERQRSLIVRFKGPPQPEVRPGPPHRITVKGRYIEGRHMAWGRKGAGSDRPRASRRGKSPPIPLESAGRWCPGCRKGSCRGCHAVSLKIEMEGDDDETVIYRSGSNEGRMRASGTSSTSISSVGSSDGGCVARTSWAK